MNFTCFDSPVTFSVAVEHSDGSAVCERYLQLGIPKHETITSMWLWNSLYQYRLESLLQCSKWLHSSIWHALFFTSHMAGTSPLLRAVSAAKLAVLNWLYVFLDSIASNLSFLFHSFSTFLIGVAWFTRRCVNKFNVLLF